MPSRPDRIVLLRSGRHLRVAIDALRARHAGCSITVVATSGTEAAVTREGIAAENCVVFDAASRFDAWPLVRRGLATRLRRRGYDRVAILGIDGAGAERANVERAALVLSPTGFDVVTPDGRILRRRTPALAWQAVLSAAWSLAALALVGGALWAPAAIARALRAPRVLKGGA